MTLKVWNAGETPKHGDLNNNFAEQGDLIAANANNIETNTSDIATNASALTSLSNGAARNPATADQNMAGHKITAVAQGVNSTDVARVDQIGWQQIGPRIIIGTTSGYPFGSVNVVLSLVAGFTRYRVEWDNVSASVDNNPLIFKFSADGVNFYGGTDYLVQSLVQSGATLAQFDTAQTFIGLSLALPTTAPTMGYLEFQAASNHCFNSFASGLQSAANGGGRWQRFCSGYFNQNQGNLMAAVLLGVTSGMGGGSMRLMGAL